MLQAPKNIDKEGKVEIYAGQFSTRTEGAHATGTKEYR
jgi:hypothetical protein